MGAKSSKSQWWQLIPPLIHQYGALVGIVSFWLERMGPILFLQWTTMFPILQHQWPPKTFPRQVETKWIPCSFRKNHYFALDVGYSSAYSSLFVFIHKVPRGVFSNLHSKPTIVQSHFFFWMFQSVIMVSILYLTRIDS